jgi:hypothetical protein
MWVLSQGVKRPESETYHSPSISAEVEKTWICTSTFPYVLMERFLVEHKDNFNFTEYISFKI